MQKDHNRRQSLDIILSLLAIALLAIALILNYFRLELFNVVPGYAPHNFWFNLTFFIPLTVSSLLISIIVNVRILANWKNRPNFIKKIISLILTTPIIIMFFYNFFMVLRVH